MRLDAWDPVYPDVPQAARRSSRLSLPALEEVPAERSTDRALNVQKAGTASVSPAMQTLLLYC